MSRSDDAIQMSIFFYISLKLQNLLLRYSQFFFDNKVLVLVFFFAYFLIGSVPLKVLILSIECSFDINIVEIDWTNVSKVGLYKTLLSKKVTSKEQIKNWNLELRI